MLCPPLENEVISAGLNIKGRGSINQATRKLAEKMGLTGFKKGNVEDRAYLIFFLKQKPKI